MVYNKEINFNVRTYENWSDKHMKRVKSAYRTLELIDLLSKSPVGLTLTEITDQMDIAKSTAHELVQTLLFSKFIQYESTNKRYCIGSRVLSLSARYIQYSTDIRRAEAFAEKLYKEFNSRVRIGVLSGDHVINIREFRHMDTSDSIRKNKEMDIPIYSSSLGTALLCHYDRKECKQLWTTFKDEITWEAFHYRLDEAIGIGMAFGSEVSDAAVYSIAVPIIGTNGDVVTAVEISIEKSKFEYEQFKEIVFRIFDIVVTYNGTPGFLSRDKYEKLIYLSLPNLSSQKVIEYLRTFETDQSNSNRRWLFTNCYNDEFKQLLFLEFILHYRKPDCTVMIPVNAVHSDELFRLSARYELPVICFQRPSRSRFVEYYVGGDGFEQGVMQMEYVVKRLKGRSKVVILEGDPYNDNARNMVMGYRYVLREHPKMELIQSIPVVNWSASEAREIIADLLEKGIKMDAIVAGTDKMAESVIEELRKYKLNGKVVLVGGDGDPSAVVRIKNREQHATVFQHPKAAAEAVISIVAALSEGELNGESMERKCLIRDYPGKEVLVLTVPYTFVDSKNVMDLDGYWSSEKTYVK